MKRIQLHLSNEGLNSSTAHAGPGHALAVFPGWRHPALGATGTLRLWEGSRLGSVAKPDSARVSTSCYLTAAHIPHEWGHYNKLGSTSGIQYATRKASPARCPVPVLSAFWFSVTAVWPWEGCLLL